MALIKTLQLWAQARTGKIKYAIPIIVAAAILACSAVFWWKYTIDDTYIALRYSHHVAAGNGPVFNIGENVEGYSCPMWVFFLGFVEWIGLDPVFVAKAVGVFCAIALVVLLHTVLRRSFGDPFIAGTITLGFAVLPGLHAYFCSGMETLSFALAIALTVSIPGLIASKTIKAFLMPMGLIAVATLRPEGLLLCVLLFMLWFITEKNIRIRIGLVLMVVVLLFLLALRYSYYGSLLPNTYFAKPSPIPHQLKGMSLLRGIVFEVDRFLSNETLRPVLDRLGGIGLLFFVILALPGRTRYPVILPSVASVLAGIVFLFYAPPDWMPADRFAFPFVFPLCILAGAGLHAFRRQVPDVAFRAFRIVFLLLLCCWSLFNVRDIFFLSRSIKHGWNNAALNGKKYSDIGDWLRENSRVTDRVLAYEIGAIGYSSRLRVIDHEGLIDKSIARIIQKAGGYVYVRWGFDMEAMEKVVRYCVNQKPEWFLVRSNTSIPLTLAQPVPWEAANETIQKTLLREFGDKMVLAKIFVMKPDDGFTRDVYLLLRRQSNGLL